MRDRVWKQYFGTAEVHPCYAGCGALISRNANDTGKSNWDNAHIVAKSAGGPMTVENLRPVCVYCNRASGTSNLFEYMYMSEFIPSALDPDHIPAVYQYRNYIPLGIPPALFQYESREIRTRVLESPPVGIIAAATGTGKTSLAIESIGRYLRGRILLWFVEMTVIISSQFNRRNVRNWKAAGFIPAETVVLFSSHLARCDYFPDTCILAVSRSRALRDYKKIIDDPRFIGFVVDECHNDVAAPETAEMLAEILKRNPAIRLGLSATPRLGNAHIETVFAPNNGRDVYILKYTIFEAIRDGLIRKPTIMFGRANGSGKLGNLTNLDELIIQIAGLISRSATKKGIIWCDTNSECSALKRLLDGKIPTEITVAVDNSNEKSTKLVKFYAAESNYIIIACNRYRMGADIPWLSFGIMLGSERKGVITLLQSLGRLTRLEDFPAIFCEMMVCQSESEYVNHMRTRLLECIEEIQTYDIKWNFAKTRGGVSIELSGGGALEFSIIGDLITFDALQVSTESIMEYFRKLTGVDISYAYLSDLFKKEGITTEIAARNYLNTRASGGLRQWWDVNQWFSINWNEILNDNREYYTLIECKRKLATMRETDADVLAARETMLSAKVYSDIIRPKDNKFPIDPVSAYNLNSFTSFFSIE